MFDVWTLGCEESEKARDIGRGVSQGKEGQGQPRPQNTTIGERGLDVINRRRYRPVACTLYLRVGDNRYSAVGRPIYTSIEVWG